MVLMPESVLEPELHHFSKTDSCSYGSSSSNCSIYEINSNGFQLPGLQMPPFDHFKGDKSSSINLLAAPQVKISNFPAAIPAPVLFPALLPPAALTPNAPAAAATGLFGLEVPPGGGLPLPHRPPPVVMIFVRF